MASSSNCNSATRRPVKLAVDVFFDFMRKTTTEKRIFERMKSAEDWEMAEDYFEKMWLIFSYNVEGYELHPEFLNRVKQFPVLGGRNGYFDHVPVENVGEVGSDGFTLTDLQNTLKKLSLVNKFGFGETILKIAEDVYSDLIEKKNGEALRTEDLRYSLEQCQLVAFLHKYPYFHSFLHDQDACKRVALIGCFYCQSYVTRIAQEIEIGDTRKELITEYPSCNDEKSPSANNQSTSRREKAKARSRKLKKILSAEKKPVPAKNSGEETEKSLSVVSSNSSPVASGNAKRKESKQMEQLIRQDTKVKQVSAASSTSPSKEKQKESKNCEKCHRTSDMCQEAKKELKKALKELKGIENKEKKKQDKLEDEIRFLKEQLARETEKVDEKDKRLEETERQLAESLETIEQLSETNRKQTFTIEKLKQKSELSFEMKQELLRLQNAKDDYLCENHSEKADRIYWKLADCSKEGNVPEWVLREVNEVKKALSTNKKTIDENIEKIQKKMVLTTAELPPLPEWPSFSVRFVAEYEKVVKGMTLDHLNETPIPSKVFIEREEIETMQQLTEHLSEENRRLTETIREKQVRIEELNDPECQICIEEIGCKMSCCGKRYHPECLAEWKKQTMSCPNCRAKISDWMLVK